jgi:hypothetical protein
MCWEQNPTGVLRTVELQRTDDLDPTPRFDKGLLAQTDRDDSVGDIAREFSEDRSITCSF